MVSATPVNTMAATMFAAPVKSTIVPELVAGLKCLTLKAAAATLPPKVATVSVTPVSTMVATMFAAPAKSTIVPVLVAGLKCLTPMVAAVMPPPKVAMVSATPVKLMTVPVLAAVQLTTPAPRDLVLPLRLQQIATTILRIIRSAAVILQKNLVQFATKRAHTNALARKSAPTALAPAQPAKLVLTAATNTTLLLVVLFVKSVSRIVTLRHLLPLTALLDLDKEAHLVQVMKLKP